MTVIFAVVFGTAVIISASLFVVLAGHHRQHKKTEGMLRLFNELSTEFGLSISKRDVFDDRIIGLDETNRNLLFVTKDGSGHIIDLDDVKTATLKKEYGLIFEGHTRKKGAKTAVKRIEVELIYKNSAPPVVLSFYDNEKSEGLKRDQAIEMGEKWQKLVSSILATHNETRTGQKRLTGKMYVDAE